MRVLSGLMLCLAVLGCPRPQEAVPATETAVVAKYDGTWWQSISQQERSGFVAGAIDCYVSDYRGARWFEGNSLDAYRDRVTAFYQASASRMGDSVFQALLAVGDSSRAEGGGQPAPVTEHGYFTGLYWMQMHLGGPEQQLGFLEGYLSCYRHFLPNEAKAFTRSPAEYRALITQWYRFDEATGDVDAERQKAPIAEALRRVNADTASR